MLYHRLKQLDNSQVTIALMSSPTVQDKRRRLTYFFLRKTLPDTVLDQYAIMEQNAGMKFLLKSKGHPPLKLFAKN